MGRYIITTTTAEDEALTYTYQQWMTHVIGNPNVLVEHVDPQTTMTQPEFFEQQVHALVLKPMDIEYRRAINDSIIDSLSTIPEADRPAARDEITVIVEKYGGSVKPKPKDT